MQTVPAPSWVDELPTFPPTASLFDEGTEAAAVEPHPEEIHLAKVERAIEYGFADRRLLRCALTSPGWVNEHKDPWTGGWPDHKALEWLGDAVLYRVVTEHLVTSGAAMCTGKSIPSRVSLISNEKLAQVGEDLDLWEELYLGNGERSNNQATGRQRYLACAVEAIIGAVYLDSKIDGRDESHTAGKLVNRLLDLHEAAQFG